MLPHVMDRFTLPGHGLSNTTDPARVVRHLAECPVIWRPWTLTGRDSEKTATGSNTQTSKNMQGFHHPVRLFLPKSKTGEYLSHLGRKVLASFPVQATLHFYNDDSSSEEEDEEEMEVEFQLSVNRTTYNTSAEYEDYESSSS